MANEREGYVKLGYEIDQGSINAVNQATAAVESRLAGLQKSTAGIGEAAEKSGSRLKDAFSRSEGAIKADQKAVDDLRKSLTEAADEADKLDKSGGGGSEFSVESLRRTGGALSQLGLGDIGGGVSKIGDIAKVGKELQNIGDAAKNLPGLLGNVATQGAALGGSLGAVAAVAVPAVAVLGALAIGFKLLSDGAKAGKDALDAALATQKDYYDKAAYYTTEQAKQEVDSLKKRAAAQQNAVNETEGALKRLEQATGISRDIGIGLPRELGDGFRALTKQLDEDKKALGESQSAIGRWEGALGSGALAANDAAEAEKKLTEARLQGIEKNIKDEQQQAQLMRSGSSKQIEDMIAARQDEIKAIEDNLPALEEQAKKSKEGAAELEKYQKRLADLKKEQTDLTNNVLPLVKAREGEKAWIDSITKGIDDRIKNEQKYADLVKNGSSKQVQDRIDAIEQEKQTLRESIDTFDELGKTNEDARKQADEYRKQLDKLGDEEGKLTSQVLPLIQAREAEAKAVEKQKAQAGIAEKLENDKAAIVQKGEEEQANIKQRGARERASIEEKYGQKLVEIARNAADEAAKALTELEQKQADLRTSLGRDEEKASRDAADKTLDIQIKAQRAERDALQEHVARLEEIRRSDYAATQKDLLDRNFLSIYQRRLSQNEQIDQENAKFGADRGKRQQAINDEVQDAQRQAQIARRERLIAFQQQQDDAHLAYQRQLVAAKQAHDKELMLAQEAHVRELAENRKKTAQDLADLQAKTTKELAARQAGAVKELQLLEKTEAQRLEIIAKYAKKANDLIANALKATPTKRAGGGYLEAGQASMVNEPESSGRESFNGVPLPGAGLFIPSQAGYVNPNGGGAGKSISNTNTFYIQAHDTEGVKREVISVLRQVMG